MKNAITSENYTILKAFLADLNTKNWGLWPATATWPSVGVDYSCNQYSNGARMANGTQVAATTITFKAVVVMPDGTKGKQFAVGHRPSAPKSALRF